MTRKYPTMLKTTTVEGRKEYHRLLQRDLRVRNRDYVGVMRNRLGFWSGRLLV